MVDQPSATVNQEAAAEPDAIAQAAPESPKQAAPYFTREPESQTQQPENTISKGTGVFARQIADQDKQDVLYTISLYSDTKPYQASDLPDHDAFLSYRAYVVPFEDNGKTFYRLRLGFFPLQHQPVPEPGIPESETSRLLRFL